ncbi:MAG TPA: hypothetical protein DDW90_07555 [Cyanobacteria bacterium UBA9971]|nr:hypothetical protein [Cyanobacteria bacterium UBA9971]
MMNFSVNSVQPNYGKQQVGFSGKKVILTQAAQILEKKTAQYAGQVGATPEHIQSKSSKPTSLLNYIIEKLKR